LFCSFDTVTTVFVDGGYTGTLVDWAKEMFGYVVKVVKRSDRKEFQVLPKRWIVERTFASIFPRQSPSPLIFASMNAEVDSIGTGLFMYSSNSRIYFRCAQRNLQLPQVEASPGSIAARKDGGNPRAGLNRDDWNNVECMITANSRSASTIGRQWANFDPQVPDAGRKHSTDIFPKKYHRAEDLKLVVTVKVL
jgi:hypothetical protein